MTYKVVVQPMNHKPWLHEFPAHLGLEVVVDNVEQSFTVMNMDSREIASMTLLLDHQVVDSYDGKWLLGRATHAPRA